MKKFDSNDLSPILSRFIWQFAKDSKLILFGLTFAMFCIDITFVWLHPYLIKNIIKSIETISAETIGTALTFYLGMWVGLLFLGYFEDIARFYSTETIGKNIKRTLLNYVNKHSISFFKDNIGQVVISKVNDITDGSKTIIKNLVISFSIYIFTQIIVFFTLYRANYLLFYYSFGATIFYLLAVYLINSHTKDTILELQDYQSDVLKKMSDELNNMCEIKNFGNEKIEKLILANSIKDVYKKVRELTFLRAKVRFIKDLSSMLLLFVNIAVLFYLRVTQDMNVATIILVIEMSVAMMQFNRNFANKMIEGIDTYNITQSNLEAIIKPFEVQNKENAIDLEKENTQLSGKIEFKCVDFGFKATKVEINDKGEEVDVEYTEKEVFKCLSVVIEAGTKVGLAGYSGSGKTTFINLIMRHFDIDRGYIIFDDKYDIRDITQESLRRNITYIQQDSNLFSRTIRENIEYGKLGATDTEIMDAAQKSGCLDFIMELPDKFDTIVGDNGTKLSVGQEKQIIIARAMLKDSPIIIFDDFLYGIDSITETKIHEALSNLTKDKTVITIAHDLSILQHMDNILVFDDGQIVEQGTHQELLDMVSYDKSGNKVDGIYKQMWENQVEGFTNNNNMAKKITNVFKGAINSVMSVVKKGEDETKN